MKLNTRDQNVDIADNEKQTIRIAAIHEARARFRAYAAKNPDRTVTTERIRRQTQDGTWDDRNAY